MYERQGGCQEQDDPIEGETDCDAKERETTADIHWISRPCEYAGGRRASVGCDSRSVGADAPEDAVGSDRHSETGNEGYGADYDSSQESTWVSRRRGLNKLRTIPATKKPRVGSAGERWEQYGV